MKTFGFAVLGVIGFFLLWAISIGLGIVSLPFHAASNIVDTEHGVIDKTLNAQNAIYNYEWFKQTAEDIKANANKIGNAQQGVDSYEKLHGDPSKWSFAVETEDGRLRSVVTGLQNQQEQLVADYNAHAKEANRNIFKDGLFPTSFTIGSNILGGHN